MHTSFAKIKFSIFSVLVLFALICTNIANAKNETNKKGLQAIHSIEGVQSYQLDNGLKILLAPDSSQENITVNMTYLVGARHENYGQTGMAHLLEHMLFRGTPSLPNALGEFSKRGLQANGSTSADRTNYYASFTADEETLKWYIDWQADAMINASITREDLDAEMTVVRNEMERGENNPFQILMQKMMAGAFQWHNYGKSTIGARSDVENVDIPQLRKFYKKYYQPDNAVLIITGKFDVDSTLENISNAFINIPKPERSLPNEYTVEPVQDGERSVSLKRQGGSPLIAAIYHVPAASDDDFIALDIGISALSDTPSGILYKNLVEKNLATNIFGFAADMYQPGFAMFGAQLEKEMDQSLALTTLKEILDNLHNNKLEQSDIDRIKNQWLTGWSRTFADPVKLASALSESVAIGDWRLFFWQRDKVENISLDQVQTALESYLVDSNRTAGLYIPTDNPNRAPASKTNDIDQLLKDYSGKESNATVADFDSSPDSINANTNVETIELKNGVLQLALLNKPTRGQQVHAKLQMKYGDAESLKGHRVNDNITAAMLARGTNKYSRQELNDMLDSLQASVSFDNGLGTLSATMMTTSEHLPSLVKLVVHILKEANFPEDQLQQIQKQSKASIDDAMSEPTSLASKALQLNANIWSKDDIRYVASFEEALEDISSIKRADLIEFHNKFYGASNISLSAVGDFNPDEVINTLSQELNNWKSNPEFNRIENPYHEVNANNFQISTPGKANAFYISSMPIPLQDTDEDFSALYLANYLLGSSETSRLWNRVRTNEGLSYNVRSSLDASSFEQSAQWVIYAIFAPENLDKVKTAINEEIQGVLENGFSEEEVTEGIKALINYRKLARSRDSVLARTWAHYLDSKRDFTWSKEIDDRLQNLTAADVNTAMQKYFKAENLSTAVAGDF